MTCQHAPLVDTQSTFYQILNLPSATSLSKQQIKVAYHKALLRNHPDKAASSFAIEPNLAIRADSSRASQNRSTNPYLSHSCHTERVYTIDEITAAFKTLSDPLLRAKYDKTLRLDRSVIVQQDGTGDVFRTGLDVVDLEDLNRDETQYQGAGQMWYRGCRCGEERGFLVTEQELEMEAEHGEIFVGCRGCSLWLKVLFAVENEVEEPHKAATSSSEIA